MMHEGPICVLGDWKREVFKGSLASLARDDSKEQIAQNDIVKWGLHSAGDSPISTR